MNLAKWLYLVSEACMTKSAQGMPPRINLEADAAKGFRRLPPGFESLQTLSDVLPFVPSSGQSPAIDLGEVKIQGLPQTIDIQHTGDPGLGAFFPAGGIGSSADLIKAVARKMEYDQAHMGPFLPPEIMGPPAPLGPIIDKGLPDPPQVYNAPDALSRQHQLAGLPPPSTEDQAAKLDYIDDVNLSKADALLAAAREQAAQHTIDGVDLTSPDVDVPLMGGSGPAIDPDMLAATGATIPSNEDVNPIFPGTSANEVIAKRQQQDAAARASSDAASTDLASAKDEASFSDKLRNLVSTYGGPAALGLGGLGALTTFLHNRSEDDEDNLRSYLPWLLLGGLGGYQTYKGMKQ